MVNHLKSVLRDVEVIGMYLSLSTTKQIQSCFEKRVPQRASDSTVVSNYNKLKIVH